VKGGKLGTFHESTKISSRKTRQKVCSKAGFGGGRKADVIKRKDARTTYARGEGMPALIGAAKKAALVGTRNPKRKQTRILTGDVKLRGSKKWVGGRRNIREGKKKLQKRASKESGTNQKKE